MPHVTTVSRDEVTVRRELEVKEEGLVGTLVLSTVDGTVGSVRVRNEFPGDLPVEAVGFKNDAEPDQGNATERAVTFTQTVGSEPVRVVFGVKLSSPPPTIDMDDPVIESVEPSDFVWTDEAEVNAVGDADVNAVGEEDVNAVGADVRVDASDAGIGMTDAVDDSAGLFERFRRVYGRRSGAYSASNDRSLPAETDGGATAAVTRQEPDETDGDPELEDGGSAASDHSVPVETPDPCGEPHADADPTAHDELPSVDSAGDRDDRIAERLRAIEGLTYEDRTSTDTDTSTSVPALETRLDRIEEQVEDVVECAESLEDLRALEDEVDTVAGRLDSQADAVETVQESVLAIESELTTVTATVGEMRAEIETLRATVEQLESFREALAVLCEDEFS